MSDRSSTHPSPWIRLGAPLLWVLLLGFGIGCLNYTEASGLDQHAAMARRRGWPEPSRTVFLGGVLCTVLAAGALGRLSVRKREGS